MICIFPSKLIEFKCENRSELFCVLGLLTLLTAKNNNWYAY
jgi:hypothetical protein